MTTAAPPARIYVGHVMHMRLRPRRHRFRYRIFSLLVDLDRLAETCAGSRLLGHNRAGILAIRDRDHGARDGSPLRPWVDARCIEAGLPRPARVEMLAFPRLWGIGFNPLTVYYCLDAEDALSALVYEVKNTFGDQIAYTRPAGPARHGLYRQTQAKAMYVSPFIAMDETYRFDVNRPGDRLALRIRQGGPAGETLIAAQTGRARPLTDRALVRAVLTHPLMSFKVVAAIHWQALRLIFKGVRYLRYPAQAEPAAHAGMVRTTSTGFR